MSFPADVPPADDQIHRALSTQHRPTRPANDSKAKRAAAAQPAAAAATTATATSTAATATSGIARPTSASSTKPPNQEQKQRPRQESEANTGSGRVTREYKRRMPKQRATAWPPSILSDPDVLSLDDEGRFVLCKVCHVHYAVHGGKKPKPVIMNSIFRTRAWEVHKERTNSHRMQKRVAENAARAETTAVPPAHTHIGQQHPQHQHQQQYPRHHQRPETAVRHDPPAISSQREQRSETVNPHDASSLRHVPPRGTQESDPPPRTPPPHPLPSLQRRQSDGASTSVPALSRTPMLVNNIMSEQDLRRRVSGNERLFIRPAGTAPMRVDSNHPTPAQSDTHGDGQVSGCCFVLCYWYERRLVTHLLPNV